LSHRATFVGEPTNGTYFTVHGITIPGGAFVRFTRVRAVWPDGRKYHGVGVVPDVHAEATVAGIRQHRDEVYEEAVATLRRIVK
jgi:C-terminal processing protease CtpA/Prc